MRTAGHLLFLYALVGWIAFAAMRIESLNTDADRILPMGDKLAQNKAVGGRGKWRAIRLDEALWRRINLRDGDAAADSRPLTAAEQAQMAQDIKRSRANYELRSFLGIFGPLQYLIVPATVCCGLLGAMNHHRRPLLMLLFLLGTFIAIAGGVLAVHRGYFTSVFNGI